MAAAQKRTVSDWNEFFHGVTGGGGAALNNSRCCVVRYFVIVVLISFQS